MINTAASKGYYYYSVHISQTHELLFYSILLNLLVCGTERSRLATQYRYTGILAK